MNEHFEFDVRIPQFLIDQLKRGEITASMLTTMTLLYSWANWKTGRVRNASAGGLRTASQKAYSERTFSDALKRLEEMGWITRHMIHGSHKDYPITLHNYKWVCDDTCEEHKKEGAGKVHILNPKELKDYVETQIARCDEASNEGSDEGCDEGSDETSDKVLSKHLSSNKPEDLSQNLPNTTEVSEEERKASSLRSDAGVATGSVANAAGSQEQESEERGVYNLHPKVEADLRDQAHIFAHHVNPDSEEAAKLEPVAFEIMYKLFSDVCARSVCLDWALELHRWNSVHKSGTPKLLFKANLTKMLTALRSDHPEGLLPSYRQCVANRCPKCKSSPFFEIVPPPPVPQPPSREAVQDRIKALAEMEKCGHSASNPDVLLIADEKGMTLLKATIPGLVVGGKMDWKKVVDLFMELDNWKLLREKTDYMFKSKGFDAEAIEAELAVGDIPKAKGFEVEEAELA
jgi:hypothetical protein